MSNDLTKLITFLNEQKRLRAEAAIGIYVSTNGAEIYYGDSEFEVAQCFDLNQEGDGTKEKNAKHIVEALNNYTTIIDIALKVIEGLQFYADENNYNHFPATSDPDCMAFVGFVIEKEAGDKAREVLSDLGSGK